ncbi:MAG: Txe/YoeB family addiction module toxin [Muribaculaceae bacterium]|nr:Txe/YoeB family addiction module toxin [Muribaculaceae bacterium]
MTYEIVYSPRAKEDLARLSRTEPAAFKKARKLLNELIEHPRTGTGHPEPLSGDRAGQWSRRISKKHRLIYEIFETEVYVDVLAAYGHYDEK